MRTENLAYLWRCNRHKGAWLTDMVSLLDLKQDEEDYLIELDEQFQQLRREGPPHTGKALSELIRETPVEARREMRLRYLRGRQNSLRERLGDIRREAGRYAGNEPAVEKLVFIETGSEKLTDELWRNEEEIARIESMPTGQEFEKVMPHQVEAARAFPLFRLLGVREKSRIKCPYDESERRLNFQIGRVGLCFACGKRVDAIGWLMQKGSSFQDAVKELAP